MVPGDSRKTRRRDFDVNVNGDERERMDEIAKWPISRVSFGAIVPEIPRGTIRSLVRANCERRQSRMDRARAHTRENISGGPAVATHARNYATCVTCAASQRRDSLSRNASVYSKEMAGMSDLSEIWNVSKW